MTESLNGTIDIFKVLWRLASFRDNWDGHGSLAPKESSIKSADLWLKYFLNEMDFKNNPKWENPSISSDEEGYIVFEWWKGDRKLTLDFDELEVMYTITNIPFVKGAFEMGSFSSASKDFQRKLLNWIFEQEI